MNIEEESIEIYINEDERVYLYPDGTYYRGGECMLFPSKDQRDWNKWVEEQKRKVPKTWNEYINSEYYEWDEAIGSLSMQDKPIYKSIFALYKIYQLIEIGYGGNPSFKEKHSFPKNPLYTIAIDCMGILCISDDITEQHLIAFHTKEQAEEFLSYLENIQLLKDYFMI